MLLSALRKYADDNKKLDDFHGRQEVRYRIDLDGNGEFVGFSEPAKGARGPEMTIPYVKRSGTAASPMPLDRGDYVLGVTTGKTDAERQKNSARTRSVHAAYVALIEEVALATGLDSMWTMHRFVARVDPASLALPEGFDASRFMAIYVAGKPPALDAAVSRWWIDRQRSVCEPATGTCAVCGAACSPVKNVPIPIRGLTRIGGQATMALVSANEDAFERHGLVRATGASICLTCGNSTHQILNQLIDDPNHALVVGNSIFLWWPTEPVDDRLLAAVLWGDGSEDVAATLRAISTGKMAPRVESSRFYAASIGANSARVVVRSWTDITLRDALGNINRWFDRIGIVTRDGSPPRRFGVHALLASVAPPGSGSPLSRLNPSLPETVINSVLTGAALPTSLLAHVLSRLRAEQGQFRSSTAALLKACITPPNHPNPEEFMTRLDATSVDAAYQCGRLLALLDDAARLATTRNNALIDRSYSAASTMPLITFTRLLRLHRAHLDKLKRDRPGAAYRIDVDIADVLVGVNQLPRTLSLDEQARFALGLYHQQADSRAKAKEAKQARLLGKVDEHAEALAEIHTDTEETEE